MGKPSCCCVYMEASWEGTALPACGLLKFNDLAFLHRLSVGILLNNHYLLANFIGVDGFRII